MHRLVFLQKIYKKQIHLNYIYRKTILGVLDPGFQLKVLLPSLDNSEIWDNWWQNFDMVKSAKRRGHQNTQRKVSLDITYTLIFKKDQCTYICARSLNKCMDGAAFTWNLYVSIQYYLYCSFFANNAPVHAFDGPEKCAFLRLRLFERFTMSNYFSGAGLEFLGLENQDLQCRWTRRPVLTLPPITVPWPRKMRGYMSHQGGCSWPLWFAFQGLWPKVTQYFSA